MTPDDGVNGVRWIPAGGIPADWITLFGRAFESATFDTDTVSFNSFDGSETILGFVKQIGFDHMLDNHLHQTVCIEADMDCFLVEWHLSFPSNAERVAWLLIAEHEKQIQGWY